MPDLVTNIAGSYPLEKYGYKSYIASPEDIIEEARAGRIFILVDDENRENEGDLVIPAQFVTPDAINFMIKHARGLVCLAITRMRSDKLGLSMMTQTNGMRHSTAFTVSIEAKEGVSTGISAADRARTIAVAINPESGRDDIVCPGHVFPLIAKDGGTLVRAGHTEASVDIARLAGLIPASVICEIINDDGTMARMPELVAFAQSHNIKIGTIADLIAYRRIKEKLVKRVEYGQVITKTKTTWKIVVFENKIDNIEHLALIKGDISGEEPVLVRMHADDLFQTLSQPNHTTTMGEAMGEIEQAGRGVIVILRDSRRDALSSDLRTRLNGLKKSHELRDYGIGAQILVDLGIKNMVLISSHNRNIVGLEGYGLNIVDRR